MSDFPEIIFPIPKEDASVLFEFYNKNFPDSQWSQEHWDRIINSNKEYILVGLKNTAVYIGLISGKIVNADSAIATIDAILIDRNFRRHGYGSFLINKFLEATFLNTSIELVSLHFRDSNESKLIKFYTDLGFKNHHQEGAYSNGEAKHYLEMTRNDFLSHNQTIEKD